MEAAAPPQLTLKVAVAVDGSDNSMDALRTAVRLLAGAASELHILHARRAVDEFRMDSLFAWRDHLKRMDGQAHSKAQALLERCCAVAEEERGLRGIPPGRMEVKGVELKGDPRDTLPGKVKELGVNMLVMGSRGNGLLKRITMGSVSTHCMHHASCPVLIIPPVKANPTTPPAKEKGVVEKPLVEKVEEQKPEEKEMEEKKVEEVQAPEENLPVDAPEVPASTEGASEKLAAAPAVDATGNDVPGALASGA
ncbi:hypothetical protein CLOM_g22120 [Closterium sp. NIES-68]|nr:hypothetical protein CLOM_g22120 [Closterium sp. NIES-68]GJP74467.1 hypothetical protein CLOP_g5043 [Closterium sp. NIES-67]